MSEVDESKRRIDEALAKISAAQGIILLMQADGIRKIDMDVATSLLDHVREALEGKDVGDDGEA